MSIGQRIKTMRIQQGLSIDDLACRLGKNRTTIYRYENGDIENLPLGILDSLADALNTTPARLMGWDTNETYVNTHKPELDYMNQWYTETGSVIFTSEEHSKLMEYAKFLLSMRDK